MKDSAIYGDYVHCERFDINGTHLSGTICTGVCDIRGLWITPGTHGVASEGYIEIFAGASSGATLLDIQVPCMHANNSLPAMLNIPGEGIHASASAIIIAGTTEAVSVFYSQPDVRVR